MGITTFGIFTIGHDGHGRGNKEAKGVGGEKGAGNNRFCFKEETSAYRHPYIWNMTETAGGKQGGRRWAAAERKELDSICSLFDLRTQHTPTMAKS